MLVSSQANSRRTAALKLFYIHIVILSFNILSGIFLPDYSFIKSTKIISLTILICLFTRQILLFVYYIFLELIGICISFATVLL